MRPSVAEGRHRAPKVTPDDLRNRCGDVRKSTKIPCFDLGGALGALGTSPGTPPTPKMSENTLFFTLAKHLQQLRCCRSAGTHTKKITTVLSPRKLFSKTGDAFALRERLRKNWRASRPSRQHKKCRWPRPSCHLPTPADTTTPDLPPFTLSLARRLSEAHMDKLQSTLEMF